MPKLGFTVDPESPLNTRKLFFACRTGCRDESQRLGEKSQRLGFKSHHAGLKSHQMGIDPHQRLSGKCLIHGSCFKVQGSWSMIHGWWLRLPPLLLGSVEFFSSREFGRRGGAFLVHSPEFMVNEGQTIVYTPTLLHSLDNNEKNQWRRRETVKCL